MESAGLVRAARRSAGLGQRAYAERAGVGLRTLVEIEAGRGNPTWTTVTRLLAAAELELTPVPRSPGATQGLTNYLHASTSSRLHRSLTGYWLPSAIRWGPTFELGELSRWGAISLDGPTAAGVWLPDQRPGSPVPVELHPDLARSPRRTDGLDLQAWLEVQGTHLAVTLRDAAVEGFVPVGVSRGTVWVPPPLTLAAHPGCGHLAEQLRVAAALLHGDAARDAAQRQVPAHRDPDERRERGEVVHRHRYRDRDLPNPLDGRGWRLGDEASLRMWLYRNPNRGTA